VIAQLSNDGINMTSLLENGHTTFEGWGKLYLPNAIVQVTLEWMDLKPS